MKKCVITKIIGGTYVVMELSSNIEYNAVLRGKFRAVKFNEKNTFTKNDSPRSKHDIYTGVLEPKLGDHVLIELQDDKCIITDILPRNNSLSRPDIANADQVILVFSASNPDFSFYLLDRFLLILAIRTLTVQLIITKIDLSLSKKLNALKNELEYYKRKLGINIYYVDSLHNINIKNLKPIFKDKISILAGQTGVGKSSLLNALMPGLNLLTNEISKALGRGKHTTRHRELFRYNGGLIADTPGFSKLDIDIFDHYILKQYYYDFLEYAKECQYKNKCLHINEPNCMVKDAVKNGIILKSRYDNYLTMIEEIKNRKVKY